MTTDQESALLARIYLGPREVRRATLYSRDARLGPPPQVVWVTCGNSSDAHIRGVFDATFADALKLLATGAALVEIGDAGSSR